MRHFLYLLFYCLFAFNVYAEKPSLMLANTYHQGILLDEYLISEKFDGVRAYWDGKQLISRQGLIFTPPKSFTQLFPQEPLDGELWLARGHFDELSGIVRSQKNEAAWNRVHYLVFDAPHYPAIFKQRYEHLQQLFKTAIPHITLVQQKIITDEKTLNTLLNAVVKQGGEGLMLHRANSYYQGNRSDDLIKLKPFQDAEAIVVDYIPGKGQFTGIMGSLQVRTLEGKMFRIGSGFSIAERRSPPAIGSNITYRYNGLTRKGLPRFARFLRIREDWQ